MNMSIRQQVRSYVIENFLYARSGHELADDEDLLSTGILDSMGVTEVIAFLEESLEINVDDADITEQNFGTVDRIVAYAETRSASNPGLRTA